MTHVTRIGKIIARLRAKAGLTQAALAKQMNISPQAVSQWERDETMPDILSLPRLSEIFGCTVDEIFGIERTESILFPIRRSGDYAYFVRDGVVLQMHEIPEDIGRGIVISVEGDTKNLQSAFSVRVEGNVQGNVTAGVALTVGGDIGGDAMAGGTVCAGGSIRGAALAGSGIRAGGTGRNK